MAPHKVKLKFVRDAKTVSEEIAALREQVIRDEDPKPVRKKKKQQRMVDLERQQARNEKRRAYNRRYYESRKEKISTEKRGRYATDEAYRERVKADVRQRRAKRSRTILLPNGGTALGLKPGDVAILLGVKRCTFSSWISGKLIPETPYSMGRGYRLYTPDMVESLSEILEIARPSRMNSVFYDTVLTAWQALGHPVEGKVREEIKPLRRARKAKVPDADPPKKRIRKKAEKA